MWIAILAGGMLLLVAGILTAILRKRLFAVTVEGESMTPAYADGDRLIARRAGVGGLRRGQVVILESPLQVHAREWRDVPLAAPERGDWMIKRVAALPGDPLPVEVAGAVTAAAGGRVPPGALVVLGDNAGFSTDSRTLGLIPGDRVLGVVLQRYTRTR